MNYLVIYTNRDMYIKILAQKNKVGIMNAKF